MNGIRNQSEFPENSVFHSFDDARNDERRKHPRYRVNIAASCLLDGLEPLEVLVIDMSHGGFGLDCALPVEQGTQVTISFPDHEMKYRATVAWKSDTRCGVQLLPDEDHISKATSDEIAIMLSRIAVNS